MRKKLMLLINPVAGRSGFRQGFSDIIELFHSAGYAPTIYMTKAALDAEKLVRTYGSMYPIIVCIGGDGTLSEVISGLMSLENPPALGYIPMGTTNDVANTLNIPKNPKKAAQRILSGTPQPFDVGSFNKENYFTYISAFGAFTGVSYETSQISKHTIGHLAYILEGMRNITNLTFEHTIVEYDGGRIEDDLMFGAVTNSTSIAGLFKFEDNIVELGDGLFEVILIRNPKNLIDLNKLISDILSKNYNSQNVMVLHSSKVSFHFNRPVAWTRDGENGGQHEAVTLINHHAAVNFIV